MAGAYCWVGVIVSVIHRWHAAMMPDLQSVSVIWDSVLFVVMKNNATIAMMNAAVVVRSRLVIALSVG
jgi:hypothetical protein